MAKIKTIRIHNNTSYTVGYGGIVKIEDLSQEFENSIHFIYCCYDKNDNLLFSIENCPVIVEYFTEKELKTNK